MLERLLPECVVSAETRQDRLDVELFAVERLALGRAVDKRRREFTTGRACARLALERLGAPLQAIPIGEHGEPRWPAGVVGSITHCDGYRACAVGWSRTLAAIGIDAEPDEPLPEGVLEDVAHGRELDLVRAGSSDVDVGRLLFSAKEAVYKAWFPLAGRWLGFDDAEVSLDLAGRKFHATLRVPGPVLAGSRLSGFQGRWAVEAGVICTAVVVPAARRPVECAAPPGLLP